MEIGRFLSFDEYKVRVLEQACEKYMLMSDEHHFVSREEIASEQQYGRLTNALENGEYTCCLSFEEFQQQCTLLLSTQRSFLMELRNAFDESARQRFTGNIQIGRAHV